ncbi:MULTISPECIES: hypothetical protein [unclassified Enterobacter]|uniref:hypothetical protein n=1 Tax=unclassified Enterobacter TaxID=2608935 RepID=UPI00292C7D7E|nr:hypothetical protein [Enterobacter sp. 23-M-SZ-13]MDV0597791.1 hypothetical protein [Enterobacter sp. 23-M-SZ-13]
MVTGGYTLDLTCDCLHCQQYMGNPDYRTEAQGYKQFVGSNSTMCFRAAKKRGWKFNANKTHCLAPGHAYRKDGDSDA